MIHHISIAVNDPSHVAQVLAELWQGKAIPFPLHPGSYIVLACDPHGTMIELHPLGTELIPGQRDEGVEHVQTSPASVYTATHAAVSVPVSEAQIRAIADHEGWRIMRCERGYFEVLEFWIENQVLLELLPPTFVAKYLTFMEPQNLEQFLALV